MRNHLCPFVGSCILECGTCASCRRLNERALQESPEPPQSLRDDALRLLAEHTQHFVPVADLWAFNMALEALREADL